MTDYGHELEFGALLEPPADRPQDVVALAELMEQIGLDVVSLSDHPYWPQRLDTMALLATIAARTTRVRVVANLANLPLRPPTTLARTAATIDILSGGRFELGIGTGAQQMWDLIVADGGPRHGAGESIEALEEAISIIRTLWTSPTPVTFTGRHYQLTDTPAGLAPAHDLGLWFGAYQPRLLRLTGRIADAWVPSSPFLPPEQLSTANQVIDDAATKAGRSPSDVRRVYNIGGEFTLSGKGFLQGPPAVWAEQLAEVAIEHGMSVFLLYRAESADDLRRLGEEVAPAVRELVAKERAAGG
ncbi:MAG TPA: LLM class flavin-dependent oxidoreductase [Pseudonocardiaceae bacterium]|jgi:alkanesulfonate monooxygenase SsuD/methylene tetrahydromethanopterin reductase-like flavin-dependent oxidoreductase (luciferase family)|nr:LLM class flavin-dependent oxidoreductase [Pseudonocardiaceae bacterium]